MSAGTYDQSGEMVYTMALCGDRLVVGTSNRKVGGVVVVSHCPGSHLPALLSAGSGVGPEEHAVC